MSSIGPELPPHLANKRKREAESNAGESDTAANLATASKGATSVSTSPEPINKSRRICGPALPPSFHTENSFSQETRSDIDSDDSGDYGPSLPGAASGDLTRAADSWNNQSSTVSTSADSKPRRDEWMTVPPKQDDLAARMDPTKIRARKFNTGKSAKGPSQSKNDDNTIWTETPEQKRKRLENEQLGISEASGSVDDARETKLKRLQDEEKARKIKEHNETHRARSLLSQHQASDKKEKEDDPSQRKFDYDKDMGASVKIGHAQKRELLNKSADFGSRFSGGTFL